MFLVPYIQPGWPGWLGEWHHPAAITADAEARYRVLLHLKEVPALIFCSAEIRDSLLNHANIMVIGLVSGKILSGRPSSCPMNDAVFWWMFPSSSPDSFRFWKSHIPRCSMYGIFTYIRAIFRVNVGKYSIHGASGIACFVVKNRIHPRWSGLFFFRRSRSWPSWSLGCDHTSASMGWSMVKICGFWCGNPGQKRMIFLLGVPPWYPPHGHGNHL